MGVIINETIDKGCKLGVWEITEDYDTLRALTYLESEDIARLNSFKNQHRKMESMSVRALLQQLTYPNARVVYKNASRKPYVSDGSYNISVTHSHRYTAILLGKDVPVGIDLEFMKPRHNMQRLQRYFINDKEYITADPTKQDLHLYIHWCAKEALYKICDKIDINFRHNLTIGAFEPNLEGGEMYGLVTNNFRNEQYVMRYKVLGKYILVYCIR